MVFVRSQDANAQVHLTRVVNDDHVLCTAGNARQAGVTCVDIKMNKIARNVLDSVCLLLIKEEYSSVYSY